MKPKILIISMLQDIALESFIEKINDIFCDDDVKRAWANEAYKVTKEGVSKCIFVRLYDDTVKYLIQGLITERYRPTFSQFPSEGREETFIEEEENIESSIEMVKKQYSHVSYVFYDTEEEGSPLVVNYNPNNPKKISTDGGRTVPRKNLILIEKAKKKELPQIFRGESETSAPIKPKKYKVRRVVPEERKSFKNVDLRGMQKKDLEYLLNLDFSLRDAEPGVEQIIDVVSEFCGVTREDILSEKRGPRVLNARRVVFFLIRCFVDDAIAAVIKRFNCERSKYHSSVRVVMNGIMYDSNYADDVATMVKILAKKRRDKKKKYFIDMITIQKTVKKYYGIPDEQYKIEPKYEKKCSFLNQIALYIAFKTTLRTQTEIAEHFGYKLESIAKTLNAVEKKIKNDKTLNADYRNLMNIVKSRVYSKHTRKINATSIRDAVLEHYKISKNELAENPNNLVPRQIAVALTLKYLPLTHREVGDIYNSTLRMVDRSVMKMKNIYKLPRYKKWLLPR